MRITNTFMNSLFNNVLTAASQRGANVGNWVLVMGSETYGNSYGIFDRDPGTGGQSIVAQFGYTRRSAVDGMNGMLAAYRTLPNVLGY